MRNSKLFALALSSAMTLVAASSASAATYVGTRSAGTATATLSITTDDTVGVLSNANIQDWTIGLVDGANSFTLTGPLSGGNSQLWINGSALTATLNDILFNFSAASGYALFQAPFIGSSMQFYCAQASTCFDFAGPGEGIDARTDFGFKRNSRTGNVVLASVKGAGAVPEPASWAMMLMGFGAVGGAMRHRRRKTSISFA